MHGRLARFSLELQVVCMTSLKAGPRCGHGWPSRGFPYQLVICVNLCKERSLLLALQFVSLVVTI